MAFLWAADAVALESDGFALETGSPDALCPELEATRESVARRLGSLVVEGHKGWLARYTIGHAPSGNPRDFVRLELFNPQGEVELRRDLPIEGDSCRTMAEVIALVLDRYFRGLGAAESTPLDAADSTESAPPSSPVSASPAVEPALEPATTSGFDLTGRGPRLSAEYAVTLAEPSLGVRVSAGFGPSFEGTFGLRWCMTAREESEPRGVSVAARAAAARASFAWRLALPPGLFHLGPAVTLAVQRASTDGLNQHTDRTRALWMAGVEAGFLVPFGRHLFVEASTSLDFLVPGGSGRFFVDNREVLPPRTLTLGWALGLGYAWGK
ncbi:MAG TPA: hypothetical protein VHM25_11075 [Polyangiaceae bacterium]|nr:hypothetical protein [Polyangiaceae bacterium]